MALKYTGRAAKLFLEAGGKEYHPGDMVPISKERAAQLSAGSALHSFEDAQGNDILDAVTTPSITSPQPDQAAASAPSKS